MANKTISKEDKSYVVATLFSNEHNIIYFNKHFYLYNDGIWRLESDENTRAWIIKEYLKLHTVPPKKQYVNEIIEYVQALTYEKYRKEIKYLNENGVSNTINVESGVLNLDTLKVSPYTKKSFCFYKLPFDYNKKIDAPVMMSFLLSSMDIDKTTRDKEYIKECKRVLKFIQEWLGYSLVSEYRLEKCLLMVGEGANGKSVLQDIWEYIIGKYNCSFVDLKYLNDGSQVFMTRNKLVNFSKDLESNQQLDTGITKSAVSGQIVIANEKYKGQVNMSFTAKIVIACNELPYIKNASMSVKRRFHILPFTKVFQDSEQDKELYKKLKAEASHIFSWAVNGLKNLKERGGFDVPKRCRYSMANYIKNNDSVELWLSEGDICEAESRAKTDEVYKDYKLFCEQSGCKAIGKSKFYDRMKIKGYEKKVYNGVYYFKGLKIDNSIFNYD